MLAQDTDEPVCIESIDCKAQMVDARGVTSAPTEGDELRSFPDLEHRGVPLMGRDRQTK